MKRLTFSARLIFLTLGAGWLAAMMLVLGVGQLGAADAAHLVGAAPPPREITRSGVAAPAAFTCTLAITTTSDGIGPNDQVTAAPLASYTGLALAVKDVPSGTVQAVAFDEWFRLDNAVVGASYNVQAIPDYTSNYNLGIRVYNYLLQEVLSDTSAIDNNSANVTLVAGNAGPYYFKVSQISASCSGRTYHLVTAYSGPTATPTGTATRTPTPTNTPPAGGSPDQYDTPPNHNDTVDQAVALGQTSVTGLTLCNQSYCDPNVPSEDQDWFVIFGVAGYHYEVNSVADGIYPALNMRVYKPDKTTLLGQVVNSNSPRIEWDVTNNPGNYYVQIWRAAGSLTNGSYHLTWNAPGPTATPTPGPDVTETPVPGLDSFEPNFDFDHAASIGLNVKYTGINFVPLPGQTVNNDYFRVRVKRGMLVTCETVDLSPGTDTNMILYDNDRNGLAGNDDVDTSRGELRSRVTVSINYDGFLYVLVGLGYGVPDFQASQYNYALQCTTPGNTVSTPTNTPVSAGGPTYTPVPSATPLPSATSPATPMPPISVRPLPTPTPPGPAQHMVTADLRVSYDANGNGAADPGEGVVGLPARVYDEVTGALLAQGFTDDSGHAVFTVPAAGSIRVTVPYLGFETIVSPAGAAIPVLISPRELPSLIP
jgi:hypothetical protein